MRQARFSRSFCPWSMASACCGPCTVKAWVTLEARSSSAAAALLPAAASIATTWDVDGQSLALLASRRRTQATGRLSLQPSAWGSQCWHGALGQGRGRKNDHYLLNADICHDCRSESLLLRL
mmetsp:Transcript_91044/g.281575  ORF Transcript_91044/g.281575 Transcript_91044/m.281575 type:complete len:122 (-) Transcript_91044:8-373(-)